MLRNATRLLTPLGVPPYILGRRGHADFQPGRVSSLHGETARNVRLCRKGKCVSPVPASGVTLVVFEANVCYSTFRATLRLLQVDRVSRQPHCARWIAPTLHEEVVVALSSCHPSPAAAVAPAGTGCPSAASTRRQVRPPSSTTVPPVTSRRRVSSSALIGLRVAARRFRTPPLAACPAARLSLRRCPPVLMAQALQNQKPLPKADV